MALVRDLHNAKVFAQLEENLTRIWVKRGVVWEK
jgi:hypothetical protein